MLKLIFSDLDGTLLNSVKSVDEKTVECIKNLDGTRFIINTGRPVFLIMWIALSLLWICLIWFVAMVLI